MLKLKRREWKGRCEFCACSSDSMYSLRSNSSILNVGGGGGVRGCLPVFFCPCCFLVFLFRCCLLWARDDSGEAGRVKIVTVDEVS